MPGYLKTVFEFSKSILASVDIDKLLPAILDLVIVETNAERCRIVLYDVSGVVLIDKGRQKGSEKEPLLDYAISRQVVAKVWASRRAIVSSNAMQDLRFGKQRKDASIIAQNLLSVACAPLVYKETTFGVIYIDNRSKQAVFTEETGDLLKGIADLMSEALMKSLQNTIAQRRQACEQQEQIRLLRDEVDRLQGYDDLIGKSPAMKKIYELIEKVKDRNINVLITGESGTGKELVARALHKRSKRKDEKFVKVDCSTISETVLESALFGHERGAFTGADKTVIGFFEEADNGTLFLDEVGNINRQVQSKLLQFLDRKIYHRVGSTRERSSNARLVFATNKNIAYLIAKGKFMEDLYFRIADGVEHVIPPLRERGEDILLIAEDILRKKAAENEIPVRGFNDDVAACLMRYSYPGNVRELRQIVTRALLNAQTDTIRLEDLPPRLLDTSAVGEAAAKTHFLIRAEPRSMEIYDRYLPERFRGARFICGSAPADSAKVPPDRVFHERLAILVNVAAGIPLKEAVKAVGAAFERNYIIHKLRETNGRIMRACELCEVDKKTLIGKIKGHALAREWFVK